MKKNSSAGNPTFGGESSETTRTNTDFNYYLAGLIDGDGCLNISKKGYLSCEIVLHIKEIDTLFYIQTIIGGSVSKKTEKSCRLRIHNNKGINDLINRINGKLQTNNKKEKLKDFCEKLNLSYIEEDFSFLTNSWFTGFFDAEGSINYNTNNNQIVFSVSQKEPEILNKINLDLNGKIYFDKSWQGYSMIFSTKSELALICDYFYKFPLLNKVNDFKTIQELSQFKKLGYHLPQSLNHKLFLETLSKIKNRK